MEGQATPFSDTIGSSAVQTQARYLSMCTIWVATAQMLPACSPPPLYRLFFVFASNFQDSAHNSELIQNSRES